MITTIIMITGHLHVHQQIRLHRVVTKNIKNPALDPDLVLNQKRGLIMMIVQGIKQISTKTIAIKVHILK